MKESSLKRLESRETEHLPLRAEGGSPGIVGDAEVENVNLLRVSRRGKGNALDPTAGRKKGPDGKGEASQSS